MLAMLAKPSTCALVKLLGRNTWTRQGSNAVMDIVSKDGTRLVVGLSLPGVPSHQHGRQHRPHQALEAPGTKHISRLLVAATHTLCRSSRFLCRSVSLLQIASGENFM